VYFTAFALLIGSALLTLFILFGITYARSEDQLDHQLQQFSAEIESHFQQEVQSAATELNRVSIEAQPALDKINRTLDDPQSKRRETELSLLSQKSDKKGILKDTKDDCYPYFHRANWSDNT